MSFPPPDLAALIYANLEGQPSRLPRITRGHVNQRCLTSSHRPPWQNSSSALPRPSLASWIKACHIAALQERKGLQEAGPEGLLSYLQSCRQPRYHATLLAVTIHHALLFLPLLQLGLQQRHTESLLHSDASFTNTLKKNKKTAHPPGSVKKTVLQKIYYIYLYIFYMNGMLNIQPKKSIKKYFHS